MAILGITNRTENWKTAQHFGPLLGSASVRLARRLLNGSDELQKGDVRLELFWHPLRDWRHQQRLSREAARQQLAASYECLFAAGSKCDLGSKVETFEGLERPEDSYTLADRNKIASNLANTEIDIVLESPQHVFVGEAKHETTFHASGSLALTHQLIREYATVRVLLDLIESDKKVVPFVVGNSTADLLRQGQARFMIEHGLMRKQNVLEWSDIEALR